MVGPRQSVQSCVKCRCMIVFKELISQGCGERHEKLPNCQDRGIVFSIPQRWLQLSGVLMLCLELELGLTQITKCILEDLIQQDAPSSHCGPWEARVCCLLSARP